MKIAALAILLFAATLNAQSTTQASLEKQFEATMSGSVMVGHSSDSRKPDAPPRSEHYTIQKVSKIAGEGDRWLFTARIPFRGGEVAVPLVVPIKWAGDTPVISVTDLTIPGGGTYTARVVIYDGHYAGTWSGGDYGGQLWGRIERVPTSQPADHPPPGSRQ